MIYLFHFYILFTFRNLILIKIFGDKFVKINKNNIELNINGNKNDYKCQLRKGGNTI
jgi:hypothetical protein